MNNWFGSHIFAFKQAITQFKRSSAHFFFNVLVLTMVFALPFAGITFLNNIYPVTDQLAISPEVTVFLKQQTPREEALNFQKSILLIADAQNQKVEVSFIPKEKALSTLEQKTQLQDVIESLGANPLPDAYIIRLPNTYSQTELAAKLNNLSASLKTQDIVDTIQIDSDWIKRLAALLGIFRMGLIFTALLLSIVVLVVTFNTIRLLVLMHLDEITLCWHIGATRSYIRRPFFYIGALLGLISSSLALLLVDLSLIPFNSTISELTKLYQSDFQLLPLGIGLSAFVLFVGGALGWFGALLSVNWQLRKIK